jgi:hypothetical protein
MNEILLVTIPASLVLAGTLGGRFLEHSLQAKREAGRQKLEKEHEVRDARRKYRENIVAPVKEALTKLQTSLETQSMVDYISKKAEGKGISLEPETIKGIESLKELLQRSEAMEQWDVLTKLIPLVAAITNKDVREQVRKAFFYSVLGRKAREEFNITDEGMNKVFDLAYQKLEDFVTLAD